MKYRPQIKKRKMFPSILFIFKVTKWLKLTLNEMNFDLLFDFNV